MHTDTQHQKKDADRTQDPTHGRAGSVHRQHVLAEQSTITITSTQHTAHARHTAQMGHDMNHSTLPHTASSIELAFFLDLIFPSGYLGRMPSLHMPMCVCAKCVCSTCVAVHGSDGVRGIRMSTEHGHQTRKRSGQQQALVCTRRLFGRYRGPCGGSCTCFPLRGHVMFIIIAFVPFAAQHERIFGTSDAYVGPTHRETDRACAHVACMSALTRAHAQSRARARTPTPRVLVLTVSPNSAITERTAG